MSKVPVNSTIKDLLSFYREERRIFGRCPHCGEVFRLSETKLTYGHEPPRDELTRLKRERDTLAQQIEELEEHITNSEDAHANEIEDLKDGHADDIDRLKTKWDDRADVEAERRARRFIREERQKAIKQSRVTTLGKTLERIAPMFSGFGHHPADVRPIFDPVALCGL